MKTIQAFVVSLLLLATGATGVYAATAGPATGSASAVIISPLTLAHVPASSLNFGTIVGTTAGTVTVAAKDGTVTSSGVTSQIGPTTADQFTVVGAAGIPFTVTLPASITVTSGANNMTINALTSFCGTGTTCTAALAGTAIGVGGTLSVTAGQATGSYTGTYSVSITY